MPDAPPNKFPEESVSRPWYPIIDGTPAALTTVKLNAVATTNKTLANNKLEATIFKKNVLKKLIYRFLVSDRNTAHHQFVC